VFRLSAYIVSILLACSTVALGGVVNLGILNFDELIPGDGDNPGVNVFSITNLTGDPLLSGFALPPDFPVFTFVDFLNSILTLDDGGSLPVVDLGIISPGPFAPPGSLLFPDTVAFTSGIFSATLSQTSLLLADGTTFIAGSSTVVVTIVPSGGSLVPGDFAIISVTGELAPEPRTIVLVLGALGAFAAFSRTRRIAA